jgi:hypothetical protein
VKAGYNRRQTSNAQERGATMARKFKIGSFYYQSGITPRPQRRPIVSTWIYQGYKKRDVSSLSCDKPFYFYIFAEFNSWFDNRQGKKGSKAGLPISTISIPSLKQAQMTMYTWSELQQDLIAIVKYLGLDSQRAARSKSEKKKRG